MSAARAHLVWCAALVSACAGSGVAETLRVSEPPAGKVYHGVYPGGITGAEDDITPADMGAYETTVGASCAWVYVSHNWYVSRAFPSATVAWLRLRGARRWKHIMIGFNAG